MGTEKRERQKANRQARMVEVEASQKAADRRSRIGFFAIIAAFLVALALLWRVAGGSDEVAEPEQDPTALTTTTAPDPDAPTTAAPAVITVPPAGATITGETPCPAEDGSSERVTSFEAAPPSCIDTGANYVATVSTTKGDYTVELDASAAPNTVNNFVVLSRYHYYDGVPFHRIIPGFVVQGGDAVGPTPGIGNPGYQFDDELPARDPETDLAYQEGSVAMANSGVNTNGSQFFVVTGESGASLPPLYSKFGQVTDGLDVVKAIEDTGTAAGVPSEEVIIKSITIEER